MYRTHLTQIQKPQPVNPELPSWPVSGFLHMLNNFRGKSQSFGDQDYISSELLGNNPSFIFILFLFFFSFLFMKVVHKFLKLLTPFLPLSVQFSRSVLSASWRYHGLQHARLSRPSPTPGVYSNSCPLNQGCHPTISSSVVPFSFCLQYFPASGTFQKSEFITSDAKVLEFQP